MPGTLGTKVLREKSKDLRIAGFVAEALAQRHGLAGLRDGIRLLHALQEQFWDTAHPEPEDGNFELREGIYEWLDGNRHLPLIVRSVPVTAGIGDLRYSFFRYQELRDIENLYLEDPDRVEALRAEGKIRAHNCPAINRLNVDGWESPSLSIAIFRQEILSFPQVFCQPTWYLT
jgi:type VI secretion system protein ImpA